MNNVRNFVKNLYFILIQICFSQAQETVLSAIGGCSVEQCRVLRRVRCGIRLRPVGYAVTRCTAKSHACATAV